MNRFTGILLACLLSAVPALAQEKAANAEEHGQQGEKPIAALLVVLDEPLGALDSLALIRPEGTGTVEDLSGLEAEIETYLESKKTLRLIPAEQVFIKVGPEFEVSAKGIAGVAEKVGAAAALFPRVFKTENNYDLQFWLVDAKGKVLLDKTLSLSSLPVEAAPKAAVSPATKPPGEPSPPAALPGPDPEAVEAYYHRALSLAPRQRVAGQGTAIGISTGHVSFGMSAAPVIINDWMVIEGAKPISEPLLAKLAGQNEIGKRIERDIGVIKTYRNIGIGMTLAGFVAAGVAAPFFKQGSDQGLTSAGVAVGVGSAVGAAGLVVWLIYGPQAARATSPYPSRHLVTQDEAQEMIEAYNSRLRRELDLADPETPPGAANERTQLEFMLFPDPRGGAVASLGFRF
ncbi:MAG TPA: hypothetical protein VM425_19450 [Myxococcota bacterium]|nr:hypothetical protein [Myxococcota bacterium]